MFDILHEIDEVLMVNEDVQSEAAGNLSASSLVELNEGGKAMLRQVFEANGIVIEES